MNDPLFIDLVLTEQGSDAALPDPGFPVVVVGSSSPGACARFWELSGVAGDRIAWLGVPNGEVNDGTEETIRAGLADALGVHGCREIWLVVEDSDPAHRGSGSAAVGMAVRSCDRIATIAGLEAEIPIVGLLMDAHVGLRKVHEAETHRVVAPKKEKKARAAPTPSGGMNYRPTYGETLMSSAPLIGSGEPASGPLGGSLGGSAGGSLGPLLGGGSPLGGGGSPISSWTSASGSASWDDPPSTSTAGMSSWEGGGAPAGGSDMSQAPWEAPSHGGGLRSDPAPLPFEAAPEQLSEAMAASVRVLQQFVGGLPKSRELLIARERLKTSRSAEECLVDLRGLVRSHGTGSPAVMDAWNMLERGLQRLPAKKGRAVMRLILD